MKHPRDEPPCKTIVWNYCRTTCPLSSPPGFSGLRQTLSDSANFIHDAIWRLNYGQQVSHNTATFRDALETATRAKEPTHMIAAVIPPTRTIHALAGTLTAFLLVVAPTNVFARQATAPDPTQPASAPDELGFRIGVHAGWFISFIEDLDTVFDGDTGFTIAADGAYDIAKNRSVVVRYQYFGRSNDVAELNQTFLNAGLRVKGIGGGVSISTVEGETGTGAYFEGIWGDKGLVGTFKVDLVSINGVQAGGISLLFGYAFGK